MGILSYQAQKFVSSQNRYHPRQQNVIQWLFRNSYARFEAVYEELYAVEYGKFRLPVIQRAAEAFRLCGDWQEGVARIRCGDFGYDFFQSLTIPCCARYRLQFHAFA
ncbi:MAG: hypothetical protein JW904_00955 [Spirochaetales bacterium]|nr:hypothetical protein [Spirochaetales bacterium]